MIVYDVRNRLCHIDEIASMNRVDGRVWIHRKKGEPIIGEFRTEARASCFIRNITKLIEE